MILERQNNCLTEDTTVAKLNLLGLEILKSMEFFSGLEECFGQ